MSVAPNTPVLVGVGTASQRVDDPTHARTALDLMLAAVRAAAHDAGASEFLTRVGAVLVPQGTWPYRDPGALLAAHFGIRAHSVLAPIGILQQTLFTRATDAIAAGDHKAVLVVGGEAKYRALRATITGTEVGDADEPESDVADLEVLTVDDPVLPRFEVERGLGMPVSQYAVMESAVRHRDGQSVAEHAHELAEFWARFSAVAATNPDAWRRDPMLAAVLEFSSAENPMLAAPYTKWHCSQWNVDQAAALLLCSVATAREFGVPESQWVYPHVAIESNAVVPLSKRRDLDRSPAVRIAGERMTALSGVTPEEMSHCDLYSCFPSAARIQARELGLANDRALTVTGGMSFAGGPLNNYVLQAMARMATVLRADPGGIGLVTSISGLLTKFGLGTWSTTPPTDGYRAEDITADVLAATSTRAGDPDFAGRVTIAGYTVSHDRGVPQLAAVIADTPAGTRAVAASFDADLAATLAAGEWIGREVSVVGAEITAIP